MLPLAQVLTPQRLIFFIMALKSVIVYFIRLPANRTNVRGFNNNSNLCLLINLTDSSMIKGR